MKHPSRYGTTCWICGQPGLRTKRLGEEIVQSCDPCKQAKGTREEIRKARDADVLAIQHHAVGYVPVYWVPAEFEKLQRDHEGCEFMLDALKCIEYYDAYAPKTQERQIKSQRKYHQEYYAKLREEQRALKGSKK